MSEIDKEIICVVNKQFVLHDSQGFEPGEETNLRIVRNFLAKRGPNMDIKE